METQIELKKLNQQLLDLTDEMKSINVQKLLNYAHVGTVLNAYKSLLSQDELVSILGKRDKNFIHECMQLSENPAELAKQIITIIRSN